ncbi:glycoside hydrolase family 88 protein [Aestuariibaculum marinum]|uniref:Glycoside hydrolase family 88 protein n=1 Tax=Aestuariibaculum marinum TaxID=2683592 RepID=A0A8J6UA35_9FLAO|nr:glycoside hydrolase family 88 protein [Aestuariibaculum marinum]MBD0822853.1 glycoside hydrolase family 88 protein [Aestuariibaculum marinum]
MKTFSSLYVAVVFFLFSCAEKSSTLESKIDDTLKIATTQYQHLMNSLSKGQYPKTYFADQDKLEISGSGWWCSGFYPGSLIYLNEDSKNPAFQKEIKRVLNDLKREQFNTTTHDLGFMMYCSFGNAERLNPSLEYETILMNSAKSLASRFDETVGCIKSWDSRNDDYLVIIDNMMNLELLFWASKYSNDSTYYDIAVTHANTTIKNHFRDDYSSYHVVNYNKNDGSIKKKHTAQGFADESAWARGQAWGLYGYTVMYRETKDEIYLNQAKAIAEFILNHPNMPKDMVPYWDFNAPDIPDALRDSSAGAIMASALLELKQYVDENLSNTYNSAAKTMISTLTSDEYLAKLGTNGGFLLKHGVGHIPENSEVDVPLTYGDYYLIEAMLRYKYNRI